MFIFMKIYLKVNIFLFWTFKLESFDISVSIAQWLALRLATGVIPGSNPGKGKNFNENK